MNRVVLVTGGSSGIGRAIAKHLAANHFVVFGTSREAKSGDLLDGFTLVRMDVRDEKSILDAVKFIQQSSGKLDVLINNAGLGMAGPIESTSQQEVDDLFRTNVHGVLNVCRACIPILRNSNHAHIINVTSLGGRVSLPFRGIYCASKFAVEGLTEALSMELKPWNILVTLVEPGDFNTSINQNRLISENVDHHLYSPDFENTLNQINEEVSNGLESEVIAKAVMRILYMKNPKLRYQVGTFAQKISVRLKQILPDRVFEKLILKHYKLKNKS